MKEEEKTDTGLMVALALAYGEIKKGAAVASAVSPDIKVTLSRTKVGGPMVMKLAHGRWKDYDLARRIAMIVRGDPHPVDIQPPNGVQQYFQLDRGNDWSFWYNGDGTATLQYRYSWPQDEWAGLEACINRLLGLPEVQAHEEA